MSEEELEDPRDHGWLARVHLPPEAVLRARRLHGDFPIPDDAQAVILNFDDRHGCAVDGDGEGLDSLSRVCDALVSRHIPRPPYEPTYGRMANVTAHRFVELVGGGSKVVTRMPRRWTHAQTVVPGVPD